MKRTADTVQLFKKSSRIYFKALGGRIAKLRKEHGMTQAELARAIGVSQQMMFAYELGERRVSVFAMAELSRVFAVPVAQLMGIDEIPLRPRQRRPSTKAMLQADRLQGLSRTSRQFVMRIIDELERIGCKRKSQANNSQELQTDRQPCNIDRHSVLAAKSTSDA